ncbi:methionine adenosyltransferase [Candidatus Undinarchaeota archaeon]
MSDRNIFVGERNVPIMDKMPLEIVERKGIGHPDSMSDGIAEAVSRALCREYMKNFDQYMHHNTDQVEIVGGYANPKFGSGQVLKPIYILLSGRATEKVGDEYVGIHTVGIEAAKSYLKETMPNLDVDKHVVIDSKMGSGSVDLVDVFGRGKSIPNANDTSFGVGFAPCSDVERLVFGTEKRLNSREFNNKFPQVGEDIKVMGMRKDDTIELTIAAAMVSGKTESLDHYKETVSAIKKEIEEMSPSVTERKVNVSVNTGDNYDTGCYFLTVTGTSAEMGDDGSTGRGNRANGLITPYRPMSLEATSGKNPINHVGKIYNLLSNRIAEEIAGQVEGVSEVYVKLLSQIGRPIDQPLAANVHINMEDGKKFSDAKGKVEKLTDYWLENITQITDWVIKGKVETF